MKEYKIKKIETEEQVLDKLICDTCKKEIHTLEACGYGAAWTLSDSWCSGCGGKTYDFCSSECLKIFVKEKT